MDYTKGLWTWDEEEAAIVSGTPGKGKIICYPVKYSKKEFEGNKNLIQAAPNMYEACLSALGALSTVEATSKVNVAVENLKQALGKAEGKEE